MLGELEHNSCMHLALSSFEDFLAPNIELLYNFFETLFTQNINMEIMKALISSSHYCLWCEVEPFWVGAQHCLANVWDPAITSGFAGRSASYNK